MVTVKVSANSTGRYKPKYVYLYEVGNNQEIGRIELENSDTFTFINRRYQGEEVHLTTKSIDWVGNKELPHEKPLEDGTYQVYNVKLGGTVIDNRGEPISKAELIEPNGVNDQTNFTTLNGGFFRYVSENTEYVNITHPGYGNMGILTYRKLHGPLLDISDLQYGLPPQENLLANGGFESEMNHWTVSGEMTPSVIPYDMDVEPIYGNNALLFTNNSIQAGYQLILNCTGLTSEISSFRSPDGAFHVFYIATEYPHTYLTYLKYDNNQLVNEVAIAEFEDTQNYNAPEITVSPEGVVHLFWNRSGTNYFGLQHVSLSPDGNLSPVEILNIENFTGLVIPQKSIESYIDHMGAIHVFWRRSNGIYYIHKNSTGGWFPVEKICDKSLFDIAMTSDHILHLVAGELSENSYLEHYVRNPETGQWMAPEMISGSFFQLLELMVDDNDALYLVSRSTDGPLANISVIKKVDNAWDPLNTIPIPNNKGDVDDLSIEIDDDQEIHLLYRFNSGRYYIRTYENQTKWSILSLISFPPQDGGHVAPFFAMFIQNNQPSALVVSKNVYKATWSMPMISNSSLSQNVTIPTDMKNPTLSLFYRNIQSNDTPLPLIEVNGTEVATLPDRIADYSGKHYWVDMSPYLGQTVTVTLTVPFTMLAKTQGYVMIDAVSIGSWTTPSIDSYEVTWDEAHRYISQITLHGQNFEAGVVSLFDDLQIGTVEVIDVNTAIVTLPAGQVPPKICTLWLKNPNQQVAGIKVNTAANQVWLPTITSYR